MHIRWLHSFAKKSLFDQVVMEYNEELIAANRRHASIINVRTGVNKSGEIPAHHVELIFDSGADGAMKPVGNLTARENLRRA